MLTTPAPEQGQLVEVRRRRFVVTEVLASSLPVSSLESATARRQHLVVLSSVDDDALGEELRVVWEIEPGATLRESLDLPRPDGFDEPRRLDALLDAVRWGATSSADVSALQAPFRSGVAIEDYQLDPVVRALRMPRVNLLIADDVGLGKTIEAGLVIQELVVRHRARRVLVVCPSPLQIQWRDQMRDKFGLEFRIVDSESIRELRRRRGIHVNPWSHFPRLITSIDFLKRERPMRLMREILPAEGEARYPRTFDILVVDEAHGVAPSGRGRYAIDSHRTSAIRTIAPHFEHRLFLTATPHNGYKESFTALLSLLDPQRFAVGIDPDPAQLDAVRVRRLKEEIRKADGSRRFPPRELEALEIDYTPEERAVFAALQKYARLRLDDARDGTERVATEFVMKLLKKRLFSSPKAFLKTLVKHKATVAPGQRARKKASRPAESVLLRQLERADEEHSEEQAYEEQTDEALALSGLSMRPSNDAERALLDELETWASLASGRPDSKAQVLIGWLHENVFRGGDWSTKRVILFTEYRDTQKWLQDLLASGGMTGGDRLMVLYGGMRSEDREAIKAAFQAHPDISPVRILLATDAASEGIDLQNHCHDLVHYEIPWNPNRLEQRNGRVDRHGQKADRVTVYHFVGKGFDARPGLSGTASGKLEDDLEFLMKAALKVEQMREDLGKVGPVLAQRVEEAMLGRRRSLDTSEADEAVRAARRSMKFERNLDEQIARLRAQLDESKKHLGLGPEAIEWVVRTALELEGQPPLLEATLAGVWPDPWGRRSRCPVFRLPALRAPWTQARAGLEHPHTHQERPIVFDHELAAGRDDVVLVHLNHLLVQMSLRLLRAELWKHDDTRLHRVTARLVPAGTLEAPALVAHARLLIIGANSHRLHEEVLEAGGLVRAGRFSRLNVGEVQAALAAALPEAAPAAEAEQLAASWETLQGSLTAALEARKRDRYESLQKHLAGRKQKELDDLRAILAELESTIRHALAGELGTQQFLPGLEPAEVEQFQRNRERLQARLASIPAELAAEEQAIEARYESPVARLFPAAVTLLVPGSR